MPVNGPQSELPLSIAVSRMADNASAPSAILPSPVEEEEEE